MRTYPSAPDVLGFYAALDVDLPDRAGNVPTRCFLPDHEDRNASASASTDNGVWYCHACSRGGGPYDAALALGHAKRDAAELCKRHALWRGDDEPALSNGKGRLSAPARQPAPLPSEADLRAWRDRLMGDERVLERLAELRGWSREALERFGLGFDGERIVFPIRDGEGALVNVERYKPGQRADGERKTLVIAGRPRDLFPAPESIEGDEVRLTEGAPDVLAMHEMGLPAVGIPGVAYAGSVEKWAPRFAGRRVVVCLDDDDAGNKAAERIAPVLARHAADVRVLFLEALNEERREGYDLTDVLLEARANGGVANARTVLLRAAEGMKSWAPANPSTGSAADQPIDGAEMLDSLSTFVRRYVAMSPSQAAVVALWTVHAHAIDVAETTPYLAVTSAEKRSGKSRLLEVLALLVARPLSTANVSDAALFRSIGESRPPTLLFDEVDATFGPKARDREDLRALLNAGYRRGATVLRCVGDGSKQKVESYPVFGAKVLAGIGKLPDTIADRSVPIRLERRSPGESVERFRRRDAEAQAGDLRESVERFAAASAEQLRDARPELPDALDDRAQDVNEPLLAIADWAGGPWPGRARRALIELYGAREPDDESSGVRLLADIRRVFDDRGADRISSADLLAALHALCEAPWSEWYGKPLTTRGLSKLLRVYGIQTRDVRLEHGDGRKAKGFHRDQLDSAWSRYVP